MNSNSRLAVRLSPSSKVGKLIFSGRYPDEIEASFIISNSYKHSTMFKVKTTAPELFCVRPNKGIIKPGDSITIEIKIRPLPQYKLLEAFKHDFKTQCVRAPAHMESFAHGWNESPGNQMVQTHYKCFFKVDEAPFGNGRILCEAIEAVLKQNTESFIYSDTSTETEILDTNGSQEEDDELPTENMEELDYFDADDADIGDSKENDTEDNFKLDNTKQYYNIGIESSLSSTTTETSILNTETGEENNLAFENLEELDYDADIEDSSDDGAEYSTKQHYTDGFMEQHDTDQENTESNSTQQDFTEYETFDGSVHFDQLIVEQDISEYESAEGPAHFDQLTAEQDISEHQSAEAPAHFNQMRASAPNTPRLAITLLMFAFAILLLALIIMHFDNIGKYLRSIQFFGVKKPDGMIKKFFKLRLFKQ